MLSRCGAIIRRDRAPVARVHFLQRVPQHIATPLLLHGPVPRVSNPRRNLHLPRGGCDRARALLRSCTRPDVLPSVYIHLGIRRMDASPRRVRSANSRWSVRQRRDLRSFRYSNYSTDDIWCAPRQRPTHREIAPLLFRFVVLAFLRPTGISVATGNISLFNSFRDGLQRSRATREKHKRVNCYIFYLKKHTGKSERIKLKNCFFFQLVTLFIFKILCH